MSLCPTWLSAQKGQDELPLETGSKRALAGGSRSAALPQRPRPRRQNVVDVVLSHKLIKSKFTPPPHPPQLNFHSGWRRPRRCNRYNETFIYAMPLCVSSFFNKIDTVLSLHTSRDARASHRIKNKKKQKQTGKKLLKTELISSNQQCHCCFSTAIHF